MEWPGGLYDLDLPIAIETDDPVALAALSAGVAELGGQVDPEARQAVRVVSECLCVGAATPGAQVAACTQSGVIYLCKPCSRCIKHELGHIFGVAQHSPNKVDLLYAIPVVDSFSAADKQVICKTGFVSGGVCH